MTGGVAEGRASGGARPLSPKELAPTWDGPRVRVRRSQRLLWLW